MVGAPAGAPVGAAPGSVVLVPGGRLGLERPLSGDPALLAAYLAGRTTPRGAVRRLTVPLASDRSLVLAGDPLGDRADAEQGVDLLVHEDRTVGVAQVWRLAAGRVLGVAALLPPDAAAEAATLWLEDPEPAAVRRRFPLR